MKSTVCCFTLRDLCINYISELEEIQRDAQAVVDKYNGMVDALYREYDACRPKTPIDKNTNIKILIMYFDGCEYIYPEVMRYNYGKVVLELHAAESLVELNKVMRDSKLYTWTDRIELSNIDDNAINTRFESQVKPYIVIDGFQTYISFLNHIIDKTHFCGSEVVLENAELLSFDKLKKFLQYIRE